MTDNGVRPLRRTRLSLVQRAQQYLVQLVEDGTYAAGERLPSQNALAAQLGISRPTLREALLNLEQEGIIVSRHGVGTFVAPGYGQRLESGLECLDSILELAARQGKELSFDRLHVEEILAGRELAERLSIAPGTSVTNVRRVILAEDRPVAFMSDSVRSSHLSSEAVDETFNGSVLDRLRGSSQIPVSFAVADIVAVSADTGLADELCVAPGSAVLLMEELLFDEDGTALDWSQNYFLPDFFRFHVVRRSCR